VAEHADVDGRRKPELLLAQKNFFARSRLAGRNEQSGHKPTYSFRVKEQINGAGSNARSWQRRRCRTEEPHCLPVSARCGTQGADVCVTGCSRSVVRSFAPAAPVSDFFSLQAVALGAANPNSLALIEPEFRRLDGL